jgi:hypothetical protein
MVYLKYTPIENGWAVQSGASLQSKPIAEVRVRKGRCTLTTRGPLPLDKLGAISAFMGMMEEERAGARKALAVR